MPDPVPVTNPRLGIPSSRPTRMFREIVRSLQANPDLRRVIKTWHVWDGQGADDSPATGNVPMLAIQPSLSASGTRDNISQGGLLIVGVTLWTLDLCADDPMDIWDRVQNVVFASDNAVDRDYRARLRDLGGMGVTVKIEQPMSMRRLPENGAILESSGSFSTTYRIQG